jgi:hypothetical protein
MKQLQEEALGWQTFSKVFSLFKRKKTLAEFYPHPQILLFFSFIAPKN